MNSSAWKKVGAAHEADLLRLRLGRPPSVKYFGREAAAPFYSKRMNVGLYGRRIVITKKAKPNWARYTAQKNAWIRAHPEATHEQIERAARAIARELGL